MLLLGSQFILTLWTLGSLLLLLASRKPNMWSASSKYDNLNPGFTNFYFLFALFKNHLKIFFLSWYIVCIFVAHLKYYLGPDKLHTSIKIFIDFLF